MIKAIAIIVATVWVCSKLGVDPGPILVGLGLLAVILWLRWRISTSRVAGARVETHRFGPGRPLDTIRHELGHSQEIEKQGGRVSHFVVNKDGSGYVKGYLPRRSGVIGSAAVRVAGGLAEGTFAYARTDMRLLEQDLAQLPSQERESARRAAYSQARATLFWNPVDAEAKRIYREGWDK